MKGRCNAFRCAIHIAQPHYGADCRNHWLSNCEVMTLRELINSVDSELYSDNALYQILRETRPEYGAGRHIQVNVVNGEIAITNCHVGSLGDIITYPIDVAPNLNVSKTQLLDAILKELSADGFSAPEQEDFWDNFDDLQKARIIR